MSSVFDFLTFAVLLLVFRAQAGLFQTGWFIESLCTQTAVIFVIRTRLVPFYRSKASRALTAVSIAIIAFALVIPFLPLAPYFDFVVPPPSYYLFLAAFVAAYLVLVEGMKHFFYRKYSHRLARCA
jgi:Mg2+-importing ATPase